MRISRMAGQELSIKAYQPSGEHMDGRACVDSTTWQKKIVIRDRFY